MINASSSPFHPLHISGFHCLLRLLPAFLLEPVTGGQEEERRQEEERMEVEKFVNLFTKRLRIDDV
jgi:hypothetical protein